MRDFAFPDFVVYILLVVAFLSVMGTILSGLIADWMIAREERKKVAAEAKVAGTVASPAAAPSTVAPSAPPSTPEPA